MNAIEVKSVKKFFGDVKALDGVSINVKQGSVYGLLGPNGAGKTTLVRAMATLLRPTSGSILVNGVDVVKHPENVRAHIGLAGQFASVDEFLTGRENIEMVGRLYHLRRSIVRQRTNEILEKFSLSDAADRPVKTYSGGMRRRLDLGASLIARPKVLFLDEPTTGLDPRTRLELWDVIRDLVKNGTTILLTTQYLEEADQLAAKIGVIDHGKLIAEGTSSELKNKLGGDVVELTLANQAHSQKAIKVITDAAKNVPIFDESSLRVSVPVKNGAKSLLVIANALNAASIEPLELSFHRPSLDDVFLALTGKKTEEAHQTPKRKQK